MATRPQLAAVDDELDQLELGLNEIEVRAVRELDNSPDETLARELVDCIVQTARLRSKIKSSDEEQTKLWAEFEELAS